VYYRILDSREEAEGMNTVRVYRLAHLSPALFRRLKAAQIEAAQVWNVCVEIHKQARMGHGTLRRAHPEMHMKYPWREKSFYPVRWPARAVSVERGRVVLPMGRERPSLVLPLELPENAGGCMLVWNHGFELHVCVEVPRAERAPGTVQATVDLGEIHLAALTTNTGKALIVTGRGIRSLKRQRNRQLGQLAKKQSRCQKHSRRWKRLQRARNKQCSRAERRIRDLRHKATRAVIDFCVEHEVGTLFIGNAHGVRDRDSGRHHNQRLSGWEYGRDIDYLTHKSKQARILSCTVQNEARVAGVRYANTNRSPEVEAGPAACAASTVTATWLEVSIRTGMSLAFA
jgi:putative transposase